MIRRLRLLLASFVLVGAVVLPVGSATAASFDFFKGPCTGNSDATVCQDKDQSQTAQNNSIYGPNGIITKIANILAIIVGVTAVIVIMVAGIQYMLSTGDPTKVNNAKNAIIYAAIGLVVAVLARTLVVFVIGKLGK
jgi:uncharacterized membrane protein YesL